jgi:hypothetical protein
MSEAVPVAFMKTVWSSAIFQSNPWSICATGDSPGWTGVADDDGAHDDQLERDR